MTATAGVSRKTYLFGALAVIGAVAYEVGQARLPLDILVAEGVLFGIGTIYALLAVRMSPTLLATRPRVTAVLTAINLTLASAVLATAAPYVSEILPLTFAVLSTTVISTVLSGDRGTGKWSRPMASALPAAAGILLVWLRSGGSGTAAGTSEVLVWGGLLIGICILLDVHWSLGQARLGARMERLTALSMVAHQLGTAAELDDIGEAVLRAFTGTYPQLNWGGILMWEPGTETLTSLPVALTPDGIKRRAEAASPALTLRPGEGVAGEAFKSGQIVHRSTAAESRADAGTRRDSANDSIRRIVGSIMSSVAAPLRKANGETIGVVSLGSSNHAYRWEPDDLVMIQGIADQAGMAVERGLLYEEQKRQATSDPLTGLPNRREFERVLFRTVLGEPFAIIAIDLDNLKMINDEYGHEAGDAVLLLVAQALRAGLRTEDALARVGGDEFAAFIPGADTAAAMEVADRLTRAMVGVSVPFGTARISSGCAAGTGADDRRRVWGEADEALYRAKTLGRNRVEVLATRPEGEARRRQRWGDNLPLLLKNHEIVSMYQPVVALASRAVVGYEALARPVIGGDDNVAIGVEGLFSAAVRMGLGRDLDWLCRRTAVEGATFMPGTSLLFVNVGVPALLDPLHDVDQMLLLLEWRGRSPETVVLEITEREAVSDRNRLREVLATYRASGFRFAMDDVGEGHSTLEMLATGQPEFIKVAQSLTRSALEAGPNAAIRALTTFAEHSGAQVIAEGIESAHDVEVLCGLGVKLGQGYHLGRPAMPAELYDGRRALTIAG